MSADKWLTLNEYSHKFRVSLSTLRRRIRSGIVKFKFEEGKYWLLEGMAGNHMHLAPSTETQASENILDSANKLMQEIKSAYISVLHEKEEQISVLREENTDLKTLVQVLEAENERLKTNYNTSAPIDSWLEKNFEV